MQDAIRYSGLFIVGFMAVTAVVIFIINLATRPRRPMMAYPGVVVPLLSITGVLGFLAGGLLVIYDRASYDSLGLKMLGLGLLAVVGSILLDGARARTKRATWPVVPARCVNQRLEKIVAAGEGDTWKWNVECEIDYAGEKYRVFPKVRWSDEAQADTAFWSEKRARLYLARKMTSDGECKLRINPNNPREGELFG